MKMLRNLGNGDIMKRIFLVIITIFSLAACQTLDEGVKAPSGEIIVNQQKYEMKYLKYEWIDGNVEIRTPDTRTVDEAIESYKKFSVKKGDKLKLQFEKMPDNVTVNQYNSKDEQETVDIVDNIITAPSTQGDYSYEVIAQWENGSTVSYIFSIEYNE